MTLDLLALGAHPDDVELCCGGWLALASERGQRVGVVDLTRGELATNGTPDVRSEEAAAAAAALGLALRENLGLPDGGLTAEDPDQLAAVVAALRRHRPGLALAPWTEARHPDHAAAAHLANKAMFFAGLRRYRPDLGAPWRPARLLAYPERHDGRPDVVVDVSAVYERKLAAIACHRSQFGAAPSGGERTATILSGSLGLEAFAVRDRYWGASIGVTHGEPYLLGAPVPISDPVAHFAAHPAVPVLVPR
jgi:N-acetylglucosamine malate deacetylase 1